MLSSELETLSVERFDVTIELDNKKAKLSSKVLRTLPWKGSNFDVCFTCSILFRLTALSRQLGPRSCQAELHYNGKMGLYVTHFEQYADKDGKKRFVIAPPAAQRLVSYMRVLRLSEALESCFSLLRINSSIEILDFSP
jgi:hypothetical protein